MKKTNIKIVSDKIKNKTTNTKYEKNISPLHVEEDAHQCLVHHVSLSPLVAEAHLVQQMCHIAELAEL